MICQDDKVKVTKKEACEILRLKISQFSKVLELCDIETENHPEDGRKNVYDLGDIARVFGEMDGRTLRDHTFRSLKEPSPGKVRAAVVEGENAGVDVSPLAAFLETQEGFAQEIVRVVSRGPDFDSETFDREVEHVRDKCFGWADETSEECTKNCNIFSACAEARNEILAKLGAQIEEDEIEKENKENLKNQIDKIKQMKEDGGISFGEWDD